ncbi:hypothetical protein Godav_018008 [Gossypium davidsonii]|uniref:Uncharacterized protein n=1 Tax=Gossypium davidsonii TaxID=34287 RepID=A0A7J8QV20_GOSDV|nr:hypothetical protein [Gossypium davidsonii]
MVLYKEIWSLVRYHRWERFYVTSKKNVVIPLVQEFYDALRDEETGRPNSVRWNTIIVRVTTVCRREKVPMKENEEFMWPTKSVIGDSLYTQKEMMRARKMSGSTNAKLNGMIRWIQETRPVLQEFARINGLQAPNYPPDIFSSIPTQHVGS